MSKPTREPGKTLFESLSQQMRRWFAVSPSEARVEHGDLAARLAALVLARGNHLHFARGDERGAAHDKTASSGAPAADEDPTR